MTTYRRIRTYWTETKRVVNGPDGEPLVKQAMCCCAAPASARKECARAAGNKTPCRCWCHSDKVALRLASPSAEESA